MRYPRFNKQILLGFSIIILMSLQTVFPLGHAALSPTVDSAMVSVQATSLTLAAGSSVYIFGFATGGCCPTGDFQSGQYAAVNDIDGFRIAGLAVTSSNTNSYPSQTAFNTIGGVAVSGYSSYTSSFQTTTAQGPNLSVSDSFTVTAANSLVVVVAIGGGAQCQQLSGVPNLSVDADTANLNPIVTIAHSNLGTGTYTATTNTQQCAAGQDPNHAGDLIGAFVFSPAGAPGGSSPTWTNITPTPPAPSPPTRWGAGFAYDPMDQYSLLFAGDGGGGCASDTWTYANGVWTQLSPASSPSTRCADTSMAYDPVDGYVLLFGGTFNGVTFGDTWSFVGGTWTNLTPSLSTSPPARWAASLAYDPVDNYMLLFGGVDSSNRNLNDVWAFKGGAWTQITTTSAPSPRSFAGLVYDPTDNGMITFGGASDTWKFVGGAWTQLSPNTTPPSRWAPGMIWDSVDGYVLMFGGWHDVSTTLQDTWKFSGNSWTQLSPSNSPSSRGGPVMTFDGTDGYPLLFGGQPAGCCTLSDTWRFGAVSAPVTVAVSVTASSGGTVTVQSAAINGGTAILVASGQTQSWNVAINTVVTLTANPDSDHSFTSWSLSSGISNAPNGQPIDTSSSSITALVSATGQATATFAVLASIQRAKQFFPILSFSSGEKWLPTSFFFDGDANLLNNNDNYMAASSTPEHYVYIHEVSDATHVGIQYWFYYTYNWYVSPTLGHLPLVDDHLHDWDTTVFIILDKTTLSPVSVGFQYHGAITYVDWTYLCSASITSACLSKQSGTDHVIVYVGEDGHGAYPTISDVTSLDSRGIHPPDQWTAGGISLYPDDYSWVTVSGLPTLTSLTGPDGNSWSLISHETVKVPGYGKGIDHPDQSVQVTNLGLPMTCFCWPDRFLNPGISIRNADPAPWRRVTGDTLWSSQKGVWDLAMPPARSVLAFVGLSPVNILVTDPLGRRTGTDSLGVLHQENPSAEYTGAGTEPQVLFISSTINGTYGLTLSGTSSGSFNVTIVTTTQSGLHSSSILGHVVKGEVLDSQLTIGSLGGLPPQLFTSTYLTDGNNSPLPSDNSGLPSANVILSNGKVRSTNPGQVLVFTNVTNIGNTSLQSLILNDTLPVDWTVHPSWLPAIGGVTVFFEFSNGTRVDITNKTMVTVSTGNPELISLSISSMTATLARQPLGPGESILLAAKLSYRLIGTSQSFTSYPRTYNDTSSASAWMQESFTGGQASAGSSGFFTTHAKVNGDVNGDGVVDIIDAGMMAYAYGSRPGDARWNPALDVLSQGEINLLDVSYVYLNYGNHA